MLHQIFDNTKKVKDFAKSYKPKEEKGKETQLFKINDVVKSTSTSRYNLQKGKIIDLYEQGGYYYYIVNNLIFRQKDIEKL